MRALVGVLVAGASALAVVTSTSSVSAGLITVVDVIPFDQSLEIQQNSEPSVAVNPQNIEQVVIGAFGGPSGSLNPYFFTNGTLWRDWTQATTLPTTLRRKLSVE